MHPLSLILLSFYILLAPSTCQEFTVTPITTSSGIYYEKIGDVLLSNNNWQFVTSVDYRGYLLFYEYLFAQANKIQEFCQKTALQECNERYEGIRTAMNRIADTDEIMAHFLGIENHKRRVKRFWAALGSAALKLAPYILEPLGKGIGNRISGSANQDSLRMFSEQIAGLYNSQKDLENNLNIQATMFRVDSEKKDLQIQSLQRMQGEIEDKIKYVEGTFAKDSEEKAKQIEDLQKMLAEAKAKIKMQEDIQNRLVNDVESIINKLKVVDEQINNINKEIGNIKSNLNTLDLKVKLNTISINFNFLLSEFEIKQKDLLDIVKKANKGDLDPYVITPLNLVQLLENVQAMLPEGTKFPLYPNIINANKLYNIIKPTVYLYNGAILFILTIPLVNSKTFSLFKMTSVPTSLGKNRFGFILPKQPYMIVDKSEQEYTLLSYQDFRESCMDITKGISVCEQVDQTSPVLLSSSDCEIQLYLNSREIPQTCNKRIVSLQKPVFLQLQRPKSWIYTVPTPDVLIFNCGNQRKSVPVLGTGFVNINSNCSVRTPDFVITSIAKFSRPVNLTYSPHLNLTDFIDVSDIENIESKDGQSNKQIFSPFDFQELKDMSHDVRKVSGGNMAPVYYVITIVGIIILILLLLFVLFRRRLIRNAPISH